MLAAVVTSAARRSG